MTKIKKLALVKGKITMLHPSTVHLFVMAVEDY